MRNNQKKQDENTEIRALKIGDKTWFVAADICRRTGIKNITTVMRSLEDYQKRMEIVKINNRPKKIHLVNEAGMLELMIRSGKFRVVSRCKGIEKLFSMLEEYEKREREIARENKNSQKRIPLQEIVESVRTILGLHGLDNREIEKHLNFLTERIAGMNALQDENESEEDFLIPTQIGWSFGKSAQKINVILEENGLQKKGDDGNWVPTKRGEQYGKVFVVGKYYSNGTVRQVKWRISILDYLKGILGEKIRKE